VVTTSANQAKTFTLKSLDRRNGDDTGAPSSDQMIIGFGSFRNVEDKQNLDQIFPETNDLPAIGKSFVTTNRYATGIRPSFIYSIDDSLALRTVKEMQEFLSSGGNYVDYFDSVSNENYDELKQDNLKDKREEDKKAKTFNNFASIYDILDTTSIQARSMFDEKFDSEVKVIAGNGRTVGEAQNIWDQFRYGYHNYSSTKNIWKAIYNLDPDDDKESTDMIFQLLSSKTEDFLQDFNTVGRSKEFETLLGADWVNQNASRGKAVDVAINEYVNQGFDGYDENSKPIINEGKGLTDAFNALIYKKVEGIKSTVRQYVKMYLYSQASVNAAQTSTTTPAATSTTTPAATTTTAPASAADFRKFEEDSKNPNFDFNTQVTEDDVEAYLAKIKTLLIDGWSV
jgi:hypothetical protein